MNNFKTHRDWNKILSLGILRIYDHNISICQEIADSIQDKFFKMDTPKISEIKNYTRIRLSCQKYLNIELLKNLKYKSDIGSVLFLINSEFR